MAASHSDQSVSAITTLPRELMEEITAKVAFHFVSDLCMLKLTSKEFVVVAEDNYVYQHASLDNFVLIPLSWFIVNKERAFLKKCKENDNMEILYREGMVEYFSYLKVKSGIEKLTKATLKGHGEATYVSSMLLMSSENNEERNQGFDLFYSLKKSMSNLVGCRKRVKVFIETMWINNSVVHGNKKFPCTCDQRCQEVEKEVPRNCSWFIENEHDGITSSCESCNAEHEVSLFCKTFQS